MEKAALNRVLRYVRKIEEIDGDKHDEVSRHGYCHAMAVVANNLDGLVAAIRDYDELLSILDKQKSDD